MPAEESFSNPLAPPDHKDEPSSAHPLSNADFRKLLTTPRGGSAVSSLSVSSSAPSTAPFSRQTSGGSHVVDVGKGKAKPGSLIHKKKKSSHIKSKKDEDDELTDILKNYRDRAKERREGETKEAADMDILQLTSGYRAMGHDAKTTLDAAERRKQMIHESKYLGGDMEHTHLVKGLDYALLQKVRSEITSKEQEEEELEKIYNAQKGEREEVEALIKLPIAKGIYRSLFKMEYPKVNEAFAPRRMAYVVELADEEYAETDIPTTLIRSKQECPVDEASTNLSTNDMVIQKLTQVLAYLRTDTKRKKKEKGDKMDEAHREKLAAQNIYDEPTDYVPELSRRPESGKKRSTKNYFEKPEDNTHRKEKEKKERMEDEREKNRGERHNRDTHSRHNRDRERDRNNRDKRDHPVDARLAQGWAPADLSLEKEQKMGRNPREGLTREEKNQGMGSVFKRGESGRSGAEPKSKMKTLRQEEDSYAECYPGYMTNFDVGGDSDDDADFTKMDLGNKKGPVKRWDFETEQDYEEYMSKREAMPKAAFQYGLKMEGGRKTRKMGTKRSERDEKQKIDRQWNQISKIIAKRKGDSSGGPDAKKQQSS